MTGLVSSYWNKKLTNILIGNYKTREVSIVLVILIFWKSVLYLAQSYFLFFTKSSNNKDKATPQFSQVNLETLSVP